MTDQDNGFAALILQARSGDREAQGELLNRYRSYLQLVADRRVDAKTRRREGVSDVVQSTFLEAQRDIAQFTGNSEPELTAWLMTILRRNVSNLHRHHFAAKRDMAKELHDDRASETATIPWYVHDPHSTTPSQRAMQGETAIRLAEVMESLPERQATAVRMRHLEGRSLAEIAQSLGCSLSASAGLIKHGLHNLRQRMKESFWS